MNPRDQNSLFFCISLSKKKHLSLTNLLLFSVIKLGLFPIIERHSSIMIHFLINVTVSIDRNCKDVFFLSVIRRLVTPEGVYGRSPCPLCKLLFFPFSQISKRRSKAYLYVS